ncbi:MAG: alkaline phosphatase D family protein [Acidimicrobiales bacterium]
MAMRATRRQFLRGSAAVGAGLTLPGLAACVPDAGAGAGPYRYGVASGDPDTTSVVLWTHHDPPAGTYDQVNVGWELASDPAFGTVLASGSAVAGATRDWTVKVIAGGLQPGTTYWYRFTSSAGTSPVGRTRTTPAAGVSHLRLGFVSCSNYGFGYFHAYRRLAERSDLDAVVHLGDYIYEHASAGFIGNVYGAARPLDPLNEIVSLDDYRRRYAWYHLDPDLAELHRQHPMICIWDDHEFANDPYIGGASNHQEALEGDWGYRVANAMRAHAEWLPTRVEDDVAYRAIPFGDLATLVLVDRQRRFLFPQPDDGDLYLGRQQFDWLDATIAGSDTTWMLLSPQSTFGSISSSMTGGGWGDRDRARVLDAVAASNVSNLVVTVGDVHKFRAMDVPRVPGSYSAATGAGSAAVEFAVGSVTSPGATDGSVGPQVRYSNGSSRGYAVMDIGPTALQMDFFGFADALKESATLPSDQWLAGLRTTNGAAHLVAAAAPA